MMPRAGRGWIAMVCQRVGVSRAGFYRNYEAQAPREASIELRDMVQKIALSTRYGYGYRKVIGQLHNEGWVVNHKRVLRIMREDNLLCLRRRRYVLTTDSKHPYFVYPNHASRLQLNAPNQLWVADITYIRLRWQFVYVAAILDAYSRRVLGWAVAETLQAEITIRALAKALEQRGPLPHGIVHHSDRGVQYCCRAYIDLLESHQFTISMSRSGNPYDNAKAESFMKTLKTEEVALQDYRDLSDVESKIGQFIEDVYNARRLHSALGYLAPVEFERRLEAARKGGELEAFSTVQRQGQGTQTPPLAPAPPSPLNSAG